MIPLGDAQARVLEACRVLPARGVPLADALGRVLAEAVVSGVDVPPFANTAMDGFAVRAADTAGAPVRLDVVGTLAAGADPSALVVGPGQAVRIMTGAPMPAGADAVVMVERTAAAADGDGVVVEVAATPGDHIRSAGDDIRVGQAVFEAGDVLTPGHLGVLASLGLSEVTVYPAATVGVLSTGDELVGAGVALRPGQIRDSNRPTLLALVAEAGCVAIDLGTAADDEDVIRSKLEDGLATCDAIVTSGGVSVGDFDYVKVVLDKIGRMDWWQVAIRPAKPFAFGVAGPAATPIFGLPGNPVSSMVSFELFVRPGVRRMMGHPDDRLSRPTVEAIADEALPRRPDGKLHLDRVVAVPGPDGRYHVRRSGGQASHLLRAMALANALALVPDGDGVAAGGTVTTMLLGTVGR
ncbi:MAG: molybdopterin molybdotransferase [Actinomycetota bacterium]|nr:molybdopterin molybdotransferase [Actinomycetota bacterium]